MGKIKLILSTLLGLFSVLFLVAPTHAITPQVSIVSLPEYVRVDHFKLSCSAIGATSAQFSFKKEGGSYSNFGPSIDLGSTPCLVDVTSTQIDSQAKYYFKVTLNSGQESETSTTYDVSGPSAVRDYSKEKVGPTTYRIHWTNPGESDFALVYIYRGEAPDFSANDDKKVTGIAGAHDANMSWDDNGLDPNKEYYYIIRALDKAGNSSSLVGDAQVTTVVTSSTSQIEGAVRVLPSEGTQGQVLKESTENAEEPTKEAGPVKEAFGEAASKISSNKNIRYLAIGAFVIALLSYFIFRKRGK